MTDIQETAEKWETDNTKLEVSYDPDRIDLVLEASYQLEGLSEVMNELLERSTLDGTQHALLSMTARIRQLSSVIMSAVDDDAESTEEIAKRLKGW
jgi:hypothetical protein